MPELREILTRKAQQAKTLVEKGRAKIVAQAGPPKQHETFEVPAAPVELPEEGKLVITATGHKGVKEEAAERAEQAMQRKPGEHGISSIARTVWKRTLGSEYFRWRENLYNQEILEAAKHNIFAKGSLARAEQIADQRYQDVLNNSNLVKRTGRGAWEFVKSALGAKTLKQEWTLKELARQVDAAETETLNRQANAAHTRIVKAVDENDAMIRKNMGEDMAKLGANANEQAIIAKGNKLMEDYAEGSLTEAQLQEQSREVWDMMKTLRRDLLKTADLYTFSLSETAKALRTQVLHGESMDTIRNWTTQAEWRIGATKLGAATSVETSDTQKVMGRVEKTVNRFEKTFLGGLVTNEATVGGGVALGICALRIPQAAIGGGSVVGGVFGANRELRRLHRELKVHNREGEMGYIFGASDKQRQFFEKFAIKKRMANDLITAIQLPDNPTEDYLRRVFGNVGDAQARINLSSQKDNRIGWVSFTSKETIETERTNLYLAMREAKQKLGSLDPVRLQAVTNGDSADVFIGKLTEMQTKVLNEGNQLLTNLNDPVQRALNLFVIGKTNPEIEVVHRRFGIGGKKETKKVSGRKHIEQQFKYKAREKAAMYGVKAAGVGMVAGELFADAAHLATTGHVDLVGPIGQVLRPILGGPQTAFEELASRAKVSAAEIKDTFDAHSQIIKNPGGFWGWAKQQLVDSHPKHLNPSVNLSKNLFIGGKFDDHTLPQGLFGTEALHKQADIMNEVIKYEYKPGWISPENWTKMTRLQQLAFQIGRRTTFLEHTPGGKDIWVKRMPTKDEALEFMKLLNPAKPAETVVSTVVTGAAHLESPPIPVGWHGPLEAARETLDRTRSELGLPGSGYTEMYGSGFNGWLTPERQRYYENRLSERLKKNPNANLDPAVEIPDYFKRQSSEYMKYLEQFLQREDMKTPMEEQCDAIACVPVYSLGEGQIIQNALEQYYLQIDATRNRQAIDPKKFEIVLFLNHPQPKREELEKQLGHSYLQGTEQRVRSGKPEVYDTEEVIKQFQETHPELRIRVMKEEFEERPRWSSIIRPLYDVALLRSMRRTEPFRRDPTIITNDIDVVRMSPTYIRDILQTMDMNQIMSWRDPSVAKIDGGVGLTDMAKESYKDAPGFLAAKRIYDFLELQRGKRHNHATHGRNTFLRGSTLAAIGGVNTQMDDGADGELGLMVFVGRKRADSLPFLHKAWLETDPRREIESWRNGKPLVYNWSEWAAMTVYGKNWKDQLKGVNQDPTLVRKEDLEREINAISLVWGGGSVSNQLIRALDFVGLRNHQAVLDRAMYKGETIGSDKLNKRLKSLGLQSSDYHIENGRIIVDKKQGHQDYHLESSTDDKGKVVTKIVIDDMSNVHKNLDEYRAKNKWNLSEQKAQQGLKSHPVATVNNQFTIEYTDYEEFDGIYGEIFVSKDYPWHPDPSNPKPRIIDLGSHIGMSVAYWKSLAPQAHITAVEANPETAKLLERNIARNKFTDIQLVQGAATDKTGKVKLYMPKPGIDFRWGDFVGGRPVDESNYNKVEVPAVHLSNLITGPIDLLKVDIEGSELVALKEAGSKLPQVKEILMEFHNDPDNPENSFDEMMNLLQRTGFKIENITAKGKPFDLTTFDRSQKIFLNIHAKR